MTWQEQLLAMEREVTGEEPVTIKSRGHVARLWAEETLRFTLMLANLVLFLALVIVAFGK